VVALAIAGRPDLNTFTRIDCGREKLSYSTPLLGTALQQEKMSLLKMKST